MIGRFGDRKFGRGWEGAGMLFESLTRVPRCLTPGDTVALVSPASWLEPAQIKETVATIESWGFRAQLGAHVHDRLGYLGGRDRHGSRT